MIDAWMSNAIALFFFNDTATTEIYTLSLHDALPISGARPLAGQRHGPPARRRVADDRPVHRPGEAHGGAVERAGLDRKSTRLNSSHANIPYAVFCLKKK